MEPALRELWAESRDLLGLPSPSLDDTAAAAVPRVDLPPTPLAFLRDHVSPGRLLLVSAAVTRHWPAASSQSVIYQGCVLVLLPAGL